jgi:hypothetical protein
MTDFRIPFFGFNRPGAKVSQGLLDSFLLQSMLASLPATYDCIKAFAQTDFTEDLKKFDVTTLILIWRSPWLRLPLGLRFEAMQTKEESVR